MLFIPYFELRCFLKHFSLKKNCGLITITTTIGYNAIKRNFFTTFFAEDVLNYTFLFCLNVNNSIHFEVKIMSLRFKALTNFIYEKVEKVFLFTIKDH